MNRTPVPEGVKPTVEPITEKQLSFMEKCRDGKDLTSLTPEQRAWVADTDFSKLTKGQAGRALDTLAPLPWAPKEWDPTGFTDVPDGRYAIPKPDGTLMFYSVKKGTHVTFLDVWASDARYPIKDKDEKRRVFEAIKADPDAGPRFGREIGRCYVCGRTLTDETSRALGIGPICRA